MATAAAFALAWPCLSKKSFLPVPPCTPPCPFVSNCLCLSLSLFIPPGLPALHFLWVSETKNGCDGNRPLTDLVGSYARSLEVIYAIQIHPTASQVSASRMVGRGPAQATIHESMVATPPWSESSRWTCRLSCTFDPFPTGGGKGTVRRRRRWRGQAQLHAPERCSCYPEVPLLYWV